ncbi:MULTISPECIES: nickel-dependent hydrogenase large subunit [Solimonas]|uniref:nickel-dependent hydrogenase large subunit n=1 Tax=Solimonas TaxID=413435 RepID=UPI00036F6210|nr:MULTISPECIES: nickel-dependent hydrogenase large subunit [Solimonas]
MSEAARRSRRLVVGPFNRVEGDLEVRLDIADGAVRKAWVNSPMYRGFEQILPGRDPFDALVYVPRICGICSVSQSLAAADALAQLSGVRMPDNGRHALNLMAGVENAADHLTHFYLFFMPDFAREAYAARDWHAEVQARYAAGAGARARTALAARQRWFTIVGLLGGKWPHTQSVQPGGSSRAVDASERLRLRALVREFRRYLERETFGDALEAVLALDTPAALRRWQAAAPASDLRLFLDIADDLDLPALGRGPGRYLSYGAYPQPDATLPLAAGFYDGGLQPLDLARVAEDLASSHYAGDAPCHPWLGETQPQLDKPGAYSWSKAPRYGGAVLETGALARAVVSGDALLCADAAAAGGNVRNRVLARLLELARLAVWAERWVDALEPGAPFFAVSRRGLQDGRAVGAHEAARGALGHWLEVRDGRIARYQIVAPTTWNFSPRDARGQPGALEAALAGTPVGAAETTPVAVQHVVRSFDPCMVCTVH